MSHAGQDKDHAYVDLDAHDNGGHGHLLNGDDGATTSSAPYMIKNQHVRECLAECLAVFVMTIFGLGGTAQLVLSGGVYGDFLMGVFAWGIGVLFGIHLAAGVSGSHLNPAITTTAALFGLHPWRKVPGYILSQILGSFLGALVIFILYRPILNSVDPERTVTYSVFVTHPNELVSNGLGLFAEILATAILMGGIFAVLDQNNRPASPFTAPAAVALLVCGIGMTFSYVAGPSINPARDLGPRLLILCAGWSDAFSADDYYFWVPIVGPTIGGALGGLVYYGLIGHHHPNKAALHGGKLFG
jgi:MIP family channel proteins